MGGLGEARGELALEKELLRMRRPLDKVVLSLKGHTPGDCCQDEVAKVPELPAVTGNGKHLGDKKESASFLSYRAKHGRSQESCAMLLQNTRRESGGGFRKGQNSGTCRRRGQGNL